MMAEAHTNPPAPTRHDTLCWYALRIRSQREFRVREDLEAAAITAFLPCTDVRMRWSDRDKTVQRPIFPGYIFALLEPAHAQRDAMAVRGVLQVLGAGAIPTPIPAQQIAALESAIASRRPVALCPYVTGETVAVKSGPLAGVHGIVKRVSGETRVLVSMEILRRTVSVQIDAADLETAAKKG